MDFQKTSCSDVFLALALVSFFFHFVCLFVCFCPFGTKFLMMQSSFVFERLYKPLDVHRILKMSDAEVLDRKNLRLLSEELSKAYISTPEGT